MKKVLTTVFIITLFAIAYVFQQTKLLEYSYCINSNKKSLSLLVDRNNTLRYNIASLESPKRLQEAVVARSAKDSYVPTECYQIRIQEMKTPAKPLIVSKSKVSKAGKFLLSMFALDAEAIAKELTD